MTGRRCELRPGYSVSRVIKGGWQLAGDHGDVDRARAVADMEKFVAAGVDTFDCADIYTGVEALIGEFIAARGTGPAVKIHTKFVPDADRLATVDRDYVNRIVDRSLCRLGVERLDLVQFHWWDYAVPGWLETVRLLDDARRAGKIDRLGVTNFDAEHVAAIVDAGVELVSAQVQYSLLDRRPAGAFTDTCRDRDVKLLCYGALAGGFIAERWLNRPDPGYAFANRSLVKYRLIIDEFGGWGLFQELLAALAAIAARRKVTLAAVALRAVLDRPQVAAVIVGARYAHHLDATLAAVRLRLDDADRADIDAVLTRAAGPGGPVYGLERDRGGRHGRIMKYNLNQIRP